MDFDLKSKWTAALYSGKYTQGEGALKRLNVREVVNTHRDEEEGGLVTTTVKTVKAQHCCLGVLDEVACEFFAAQGHKQSHLFGFDAEVEAAVIPNNGWNSVGDVQGNTGKFSPDQLQALGMSSNLQQILIALNDAHASFEAIAKVIGDIDGLVVSRDQYREDRDAFRLRALEAERLLAVSQKATVDL